MMPTIIDTHTHLYDIPDVVSALSASAAAGVSDVVALGVDLASNKKHVEIISTPAPLRVHLGLGIHPGNLTAQELETCLPFFREHIHKAVAIGEIGLDFWYKTVRQDDTKKNEQRVAFAKQLELAHEFDLPVVIHSRGTWRECLATTLAAGVTRGVFHWYTGPEDVLKEILDAGFLISVSPALTYSPEARAAALYAPIDRILVETDTPVRITDPSGERVPSSPKDVWLTFRSLCALKNIDELSTLDRVNSSARTLFRLP